MADFNKYAPLLMQLEGGFVDNPNDKGGPTNKGITLKTFVTFRHLMNKPLPTIDDLKNISDEEWGEIMKSLYWNKFRADKIHNQAIAEIVVDWYINSGTTAIKKVQRLLGVIADGIVGRNTIFAINGMNPQYFFNKVKDARAEYYKKITVRNPTYKVFYNGWMNRLNRFKYDNE